MNVGFIGLGNIGRPMAARIAAAGHSLVLHDISRENSQALVEQGASWADAPRTVAQESELICTSLPGPVEFEQVVMGENGILAGANPDSTLIDFTTNSAFVVRQIHQQLASKQVGLLDAPVSGGVEGARNGALTVLVGGDKQSFEKAMPVFDAVAKKTIHLGEVGTASICKALHNCAVFCTNLAMMECLTVGVKAGIDAQKLVDVFQSSGLGSNLDLQVAMPATLFQGNFQPRFAMKTAFKDMGLATELAQSTGVPARIVELCAKDMGEAIDRGWGDQDNTVFLKIQEERAGAQVRVTKSDDE